MTADPRQALVAGLLNTHGNQLRRFLVSRVRNPADIPDIIQEVYLRMLRVPDVEAVRSPEAYLFTVARHVAQQHGLRQAATTRSLELQDMLAELTEAPNDPALEVSAEESIRELDRALARLTPNARAAFLYHRRDGLTLEEIGQRFGVSRAMAKKYLAKALLEFRKLLAQSE